MQKFFVEHHQIEDNIINITGPDVNHILNVLKLEIGENVLVGDLKSGATYLCSITEKDRENIAVNIIKKEETTTEPNVYIHLFQGLPKSDKMEYILQKCTEIGVSEFTPVAMNRCIVKLDEKEKIKKNQRWGQIAKSAAEQSKRDIIPKINLTKNFKNIFEFLKEYDIVLVAYENELNNCIKNELKNVNPKPNKIAIIIGPEGGLERTEVDEIINCGGKCVTLGKRILRTETAPIVMSTAILYELGNI